ncbi:MAG: mycofactocin radical SAM maturase [Oligoflexia bacterium]|nr:mycofactocin radical SAM maturase [Oligoflexia bacterium]
MNITNKNKHKNNSNFNLNLHHGLISPVNVTWEITSKCNLFCKHCLSSAHNTNIANSEELSTSEVFTVIDDLAKNMVFQINFGGGEPTLREDFSTILKYCHQKNIVTCISTNGTEPLIKIIDNDDIKSSMLKMQISLDGITAETNDLIRGQGSFAKTWKTINSLLDLKIFFSVNLVLNKINFHEIDMLYDWVIKNKLTLRISRLRPSGRALDNWSELMLSKKELLHFSSWLSKHINVVTGDSFFSLEDDLRQQQSSGLNLCGAAKFTCCIAPDGELYPCAFLQDKVFSAGNVRKQSIAQMWNKSESFIRIRNLDASECKSCGRYDFCHGGCLAMVYFHDNSFKSADPDCLINCSSI